MNTYLNKYILFLIIILSNLYSYGNSEAKHANSHSTIDVIFIPDNQFELALFNLGIDTFYGDGLVQTSNVAGLTSLDVSNKGITDLTGINSFIDLQTLNCSQNQIVTLEINNLYALTTLNCNNNLLTTLLLNSLPEFQSLDCSENPLTSLDLTNVPSLISLDCSYCQLNTLSVTNLIHLTILKCNNNQLTSLGISTLSALLTLECQNNQLGSLQAENLTFLSNLNCSNNNINTLGVMNAFNLSDLNCSNNFLIGINANTLNNLQYFNCSHNLLESLNVSNSHNLIAINCSYNFITNLNMSGFSQIIVFDCYNNNLTALNLSGSTVLALNCTNNPNLSCITVSDIIEATTNQSWQKDITAGYSTDCGNGGSTAAVISGNATICQGNSASIFVNITGGTAPYTVVYFDGVNENTEYFYTSNSPISVQPWQTTTYSIVSISDSNAYTGTNNSGTATIIVQPSVFYYLDADNDGYGNILNQVMSCDGTQPNGYVTNALDCDDTNYNRNPARVEIIGNGLDDNCNGVVDEDYTEIPDTNFEQALFDLGIDAVNGDHKVLTSAISTITTLNVSGRVIENLKGIEGFVALTLLDCSFNFIGQLNITGLENLVHLNCKSNSLGSLNFDGLNHLLYVDCSYNNLSTLSTTGVSELLTLYCNNNNLSNLNLNSLSNLFDIKCNNNSISTLQINQSSGLINLECQNNLLTNINLPNTTAVQSINCSNNQLTTLSVQGLLNLYSLNCATNLLQNLDVSNLPSLELLNCKENYISNLNLTNANSLQNIICHSNFITNIDVSLFPALTLLDCRFNALESLNVVSLSPSAGDILFCNLNPSLQCITVADPQDAYDADQIGYWVKDSSANFSVNCEQSTYLNADLTNSNTICIGNSSHLIVNVTGGTSPYTINFTDGLTTTTVSNYSSGNHIPVSPNATTTYTLISISDSNNLFTTGNLGSATITVAPNVVYYEDLDGDNFGNSAVYITTCNVIPNGFVSNNEDCDDNNSTITTPVISNTSISSCDQTFCNEATVEDLRFYATPNYYTVNWYDSATSQDALESNHQLQTGTFYVEEILENVYPVISGVHPKDVTIHPNGSVIMLDFYGINKYNEFSGWGFSNINPAEWFLGGTEFRSVQIDLNHKIVTSTNNGVYRFNIDGSGFEQITSTSLFSIAIQNDGKLIGDFNGKIYRFNTDGSLDTILLDSGTPEIFYSSVAVQPDGKIVFFEQDNTTFSGTYSIKRMEPNGTDMETIIENTGTIYDIVIQPNGKIVFTNNYNSAIHRLNSDGSQLEIIGTNSGYGEPRGLATTSNQDIYYADFYNNEIRRINYTYSNRFPIQVVVNPLQDHISTIEACDTYAWENNGETYTESGTYTGKTTNCIKEVLQLTIMPCQLSILDEDYNKLKIFPNPTANFINIISEEKISSAEIYDINGRQLLKTNKVEDKISAEKLPKGIYLLKLQLENGEVVMEKIIKI